MTKLDFIGITTADMGKAPQQRLLSGERRSEMNGRTRWLVGMMISLGLTLTTGAPAAAECNFQPNRWPAFSELAHSADRVIVGTVAEPAGLRDISPYVSYVVRVDEVLRGSAPATIEVRALRSGLPRVGDSSCRASALLYARIGDVIAFAFDGELPDVAGEVNTAAWIEGRPHSLLVPGPERLTLDEVRYYASLPDTSTWSGLSLLEPQDAPASIMLMLAAVVGALAIGRRLRRSDTGA